MISHNERIDEAAAAEPTESVAVRDAASGQTQDEYLRIEQVSVRLGLTKRTLRYYEEIGLLAPPTRTEGGYRLYSTADIQHLQRIKRLKELLGFSLAEIREIAEVEEEREHVRAAWRQETDPRAKLAWLDKGEQLTQRQLHLVEEKLAGLTEMRDHLVSRQEQQKRARADLLVQLGETHGKGSAR